MRYEERGRGRGGGGAPNLFVAQGVNRVEVGGFPGGVGSENDAHDRTDHQADNDPIHGDYCGFFQKEGGGIAAENAEDNANCPADFAQDDRLHDELGHDVALFGPDGAADADFAGAFGDGDEHDVHNADAGGEQGDGADKGNAQADGPGEGFELGDERVVGQDLKVVLLSRRHFAEHAHDAAGFFDGVIVAGLIAGLDQEVQAAVPASEPV